MKFNLTLSMTKYYFLAIGCNQCIEDHISSSTFQEVIKNYSADEILIYRDFYLLFFRLNDVNKEYSRYKTYLYNLSRICAQTEPIL